MSEEAIEIWEKVVEKGVEKINKYEDALFNGDSEGFKKLHSEYVAYVKKIAEITRINEEELDLCFYNKSMEN